MISSILCICELLRKENGTHYACYTLFLHKNLRSYFIKLNHTSVGLWLEVDSVMNSICPKAFDGPTTSKHSDSDHSLSPVSERFCSIQSNVCKHIPHHENSGKVYNLRSNNCKHQIKIESKQTDHLVWFQLHTVDLQQTLCTL